MAHVLEALSIVAKPTQVRSLRQSSQAKALHFARTCYDHLAGEVGVALTSKMLEFEWLISDGKNFTLTDGGTSGLRTIGVDTGKIRTGRRAFARQCLDWSERRYHLAGVLGTTITTRFFDLGWIERTTPTRAVTVTERGVEGLLRHFDIRVRELGNDHKTH